MMGRRPGEVAQALVAVTAIALSGVALTACGGGGISEAELDRERAEAAQNARQEAEITALKNELRAKDQPTPQGSSSANPVPAEPSSVGQIPADAYYCGSAYGDGSASCPFVENVSDDYYTSGESNVFMSYSPTTEKTYTVTCNGDAPTVCTAGRAAVIYIP